MTRAVTATARKGAPPARPVPRAEAAGEETVF
jgi:hypothetical protein